MKGVLLDWFFQGEDAVKVFGIVDSISESDYEEHRTEIFEQLVGDYGIHPI